MNFYKKSKVIKRSNDLASIANHLYQVFVDMMDMMKEPPYGIECSSNTDIDMAKLFVELNDKAIKFSEKMELMPTPITIEPPLPISRDDRSLHYYMSDLWKRIPSHDPLFGYQPQSDGDDPCEGCPSKGKEFCNCTLGDPNLRLLK